MKQVELYFLIENIFNFIGLGFLALMILGVIFFCIKDIIEEKKENNND